MYIELDSRIEAIRGNASQTSIELNSNSGDKFRAMWRYHDSTLENYSYNFQPLLGEPVEDFVRKQLDDGKSKSILDLMASETAVREAVDMGFSYGQAVSLGFQADGKRVRSKGIVETVNGDILSYRTWSEMRKRMEVNGVDTFDVILSRPEGGLKLLTINPFVHFWLLQKTWGLLSANSGQLLMQIPNVGRDNALDYFDELNRRDLALIRYDSVSAINMRNNFGLAVHLQKTPDSPARLPAPRTLGIPSIFV